MTDQPQTPDAPTARMPQVFALRDLGVAPENMRFDEAPDDGIPLLASTIRAAGLMQPLTVRPGRKKEKPAMALDGRRRLLALGLLLEDGAIGDDYPVEAFVETDPGRQAAAVVLTNTAVAVHVADVISAIGKMLRAKLEIPSIAAALGYGEIEVRRLAALSGLTPAALAQLKAGRMTLRQAKLLARVSDAKVRAQIVEAVAGGYGFPEHRTNEALDRGQVTRADRRFVLVGAERYAAAGGRIESDLFGELPDVLLDPGLLDDLWTARAKALGEQIGQPDIVIHATSEPDPDWPEGLDPYGYDDVDLNDGQVDALEAAEAAENTAWELLAAVDPSSEASDAPLVAYIAARLAHEQAHDPGRAVTQLLLNPGRSRPVMVQAFAPPTMLEATATEDADVDADHLDAGSVCGPAGARGFSGTAAVVPTAPPPGATPEGASHALHEVRTDLATRALIRAVADHPSTALVALVARLFSVELLHQRGGEGALTISASVYGKPRARQVDALDGDVRRRLAERRAAWRETGKSVITWVDGLAPGDTMDLLAELVAVSLDLSEERTTLMRRSARSEAAEIAGLCAADVTVHWTPDDVFLRAHSKPQLLAMLEAMDELEGVAKSLKKEELVDVVVEAAARRRWAPDYLSWRTGDEGAGAVDDGEVGADGSASTAQDADQPPIAA